MPKDPLEKSIPSSSFFTGWPAKELLSFSKVFNTSAEDLEMHQIYDVAHNTAKLENHVVNGKKKQVLVHRKGATRAFGPGRSDIPDEYKEIGQPVIIGGSMETGSY